MEQQNEIRHLLEKYLHGQLTLPEKLRLAALIKKSTDAALNQALEKLMDQQEWTDEEFFQRDWNPVLQQIVAKKSRVIPFARMRSNRTPRKRMTGTRIPAYNIPANRVPANRIWGIPISANGLRYAALLLLLAGAGGFWFFNRTTEPAACHIRVPDKKDKDIVQMKIEHGMVSLTVPRSWQYRLTLPDSTRVWLNAESTIQYAYAFNAAERRIVLTGEAFFEVAADSSRPFYVKAGEATIKATSARFNISAYAEEETIKASLVSGNLLLKAAGQEQWLQAGQELVVATGNGPAHPSPPELIATGYREAAWKEGYFSFVGEKLPAIMSELARWYNWNVSYSGPVPIATLSGTYCRETSESHMLAILADNGIKTIKEGRNISVIQ